MLKISAEIRTPDLPFGEPFIVILRCIKLNATGELLSPQKLLRDG